MKKVVIHRSGSYRRLEIEEHPDLEPGPDEVVIAVEAAGVNYADVVVRMGLYASARELVGFPITPGFEVAGTVLRIGPTVSRLKPGDRVLAVTLFDGYATQVRVRQELAFVIPENIETAVAAGFPTVFLTAWYALIELCRLRRAMRVLVHSAAGGVGGALVQIAAQTGCEVTGVVGASHKLEAARRHGAKAVIDKSSEPLWPAAERHAPKGYDVILDANGVSTLAQSYRHLRPSGRLVIYGFHSMMPKQGGRPSWGKLAVDWVRTPRFNPLQLTNDNKSVMAFNLSYLFERLDILDEAMTDLFSWLRTGRIWPHTVERIPFFEVAEAHRKIESGRTVGKLVLIMPERQD